MDQRWNTISELEILAGDLKEARTDLPDRIDEPTSSPCHHAINDAIKEMDTARYAAISALAFLQALIALVACVH